MGNWQSNKVPREKFNKRHYLKMESDPLVEWALSRGFYDYKNHEHVLYMSEYEYRTTINNNYPDYEETYKINYIIYGAIKKEIFLSNENKDIVMGFINNIKDLIKNINETLKLYSDFALFTVKINNVIFSKDGLIELKDSLQTWLDTLENVEGQT